MADTSKQNDSLPSKGGSYKRSGDTLSRVEHTAPAQDVFSRRKDEAQAPATKPAAGKKE